MQQKTRTWLLIAGIAALLAFAALIFYRFPHLLKLSGIDSGDLGGAAMAALILWLVMRKNQPMAPKTRLILAVSVAVGLLLGLAVFFMT